MGCFRKNRNRGEWGGGAGGRGGIGGGGVEDMGFPGVLKNIWKLQGLSKKRVEFSPNKKNRQISMGLGFWFWNFQGV